MTISKDTCGSWASLLTPTSEEDVRAYVAGIKTWLLRTGGTLLVEEAELVSLPPTAVLLKTMVVLQGREYPSGVATCASVPLTEIAALAA